MALTFVPIVHIVAAIFAAVELGLTAYCTFMLMTTPLPQLPSTTPFHNSPPARPRHEASVNAKTRGESLGRRLRGLLVLPPEHKLPGLRLGLVAARADLHRPDAAVHDVRVPPPRGPRAERRDRHILVCRRHRRRRWLWRALQLPRGLGMLRCRGGHRICVFPLVRLFQSAPSLHLPDVAYIDGGSSTVTKRSTRRL